VEKPAYDRLVAAAAGEMDTPRRFDFLRQAESLLIAESPATPVFFGARTYLIHPDVQGWEQALLGIHRYQTIRLAP
jgi:oligopeptide transport system substrate-binding protein